MVKFTEFLIHVKQRHFMFIAKLLFVCLQFLSFVCSISLGGAKPLIDSKQIHSDLSLNSHPGSSTHLAETSLSKKSCWTDILSILRICKEFVLSHTSTVVMVPIYLFSLSIIDVPRSVYIFFCISTTIFPGIRPLWWRVLMWYTSLLTLAVYVICILSGPLLTEYVKSEWIELFELFGLQDYGIRWCVFFFGLFVCKVHHRSNNSSR